MSKRLIYAEDATQTALDFFVEFYGGAFDENAQKELIARFQRLPSAQPEIVYCKKCKHWTRTYGDERWGLGDCDVFDKHLVMCNGYCAWAERKDND